MSILTGPHAQINADVQRQWRELMRHHPILARQEDPPEHDEGMAVETLFSFLHPEVKRALLAIVLDDLVDLIDERIRLHHVGGAAVKPTAGLLGRGTP